MRKTQTKAVAALDVLAVVQNTEFGGQLEVLLMKDESYGLIPTSDIEVLAFDNNHEPIELETLLPGSDVLIEIYMAGGVTAHADYLLNGVDEKDVGTVELRYKGEKVVLQFES